jgi:formylglycine-generating enzyme required for sulfatase activity
MIYCLNPICQKPKNPHNTKFCISCGTKLIEKLRGRFTITGALSQGGFGKTYLAEDEDRRKAICVIKQFATSPDIQSQPAAYQKAVELFNQEAERLLHLEDHPQIPTLFAYFEEQNYLYLVQQFIKGQTLSEELKQQGTFNENKIRELLNDLLPVLEFVHSRQVIHRDIKPDNIIRRQSDGKLILIDFGVAKQASGTLLTHVGTSVGTPGYAPVEQQRGVVYPASDLYSLAVTCIRLITGILPNGDGTDPLFDCFNGEWLWQKKLPPNTTISTQLGQVLDKLLKEYAKARYQTASEVLVALNNFPPQSASETQKNQQHHASSYATFPSQKSTMLKTFSFNVITVDARGKPTNQQQKQAEYFAEDLGKGVILEMVSIPGGTFNMGSHSTEERRCHDESPQHWVNVAPFFLGKYAVTQAQWKAIASLPKVQQDLKLDPSSFKGANRPVEQVSWEDAVEFCARLSKKTGKSYRLPSEAEWEYACRAGTTTPFHFGETLTPILANYDVNHIYAFGPRGKYRQQTVNVGSFPPNAFGLYELHGNVWEWCTDPWHKNYAGAPVDSSVWNAGGDNQYRVLRGGSWYNYPWRCRSAYRLKVVPDFRWWRFGFRFAVSLP